MLLEVCQVRVKYAIKGCGQYIQIFQKKTQYAENVVQNIFWEIVMSKPKIRLISQDDWEQFFINDRLVYENHNVEAYFILEQLQKLGIIEFESIYGAKCAYCDYFAEGEDSIDKCPECGKESF
jgi:rubrerythrin